MSATNPPTPRHRGKNWSKAEDEALLAGARLHGNKWEIVASAPALKDRSAVQCQSRHTRLLRAFAGKDNAPTPLPAAVSSPTQHDVEEIKVAGPAPIPTPIPAPIPSAVASGLDASQDAILKPLLVGAATTIDYCGNCHKIPASLECMFMRQTRF